VTNETVNALLGLTAKTFDALFGDKTFTWKKADREAIHACQFPHLFAFSFAEAFLRKHHRKRQGYMPIHTGTSLTHGSSDSVLLTMVVVKLTSSLLPLSRFSRIRPRTYFDSSVCQLVD